MIEKRFRIVYSTRVSKSKNYEIKNGMMLRVKSVKVFAD